MPRYFTLAEARQYLPAVRSAVRDGMDAKKVMETAEQDQRAMVQRIMFSGGMAVNHDAAIQVRATREACSAKLKQLLDNFEEIGCLVKDLDVGLIDFPALYRGMEVYLCWRFGEADIRFWHPIDEGFAGRRPIDAEFLSECGGDGE
jgi:hypothetical protein